MSDHDQLVAEIQRDWATVGLTGSFLARNLHTRKELGFGHEIEWPLASVAKLPIALVVHDAFERGDLDPAEPFEIEPDNAASGPTGLSLFRHPCRVAAEDLVQSSLAVSDNVATDLLLARLGIAEVTNRLAELGFPEIIIRHSMRLIYGIAGTVGRISRGIATTAQTKGGGHLIGELDPHRANVGTARTLLELLDRIWSDSVSSPAVCSRLRTALSWPLIQHRIAVELASDAVRIFSKTGSFLHLRHEVAVVEIGDDAIGIAALTASQVPASVQLEADFAIGHAARLAVDELRS